MESKSDTIIPDLEAITQGKLWKGSLDTVTLAQKDGKPAVEIDKEDFNIIWLDGFEFTNGTIEFDAKGKSEPAQGSFIGVAFRVVDDVTYDSIYFRPFNFGASDKERKSHAVQYISHPEWPWYRLRKEKPGQFEQPIEPELDGNKWLHAKVVIEEQQLQVFVNDAKTPSLQVTELSDRSGGSVGLWCFGYGVISNLQISPARLHSIQEIGI